MEDKDVLKNLVRVLEALDYDENQLAYAVSLQKNCRKQIEKLRHALNLLEQGTYGYCERCLAKLDEAALHLDPAGTICNRCRGLLELMTVVEVSLACAGAPVPVLAVDERCHISPSGGATMVTRPGRTPSPAE